MYGILGIFMPVEKQLQERKISLVDGDELIRLMINEVKGKRNKNTYIEIEKKSQIAFSW